MSGITCARCREVAPDLALGIAEGTERAAVIEHVAGCTACRRDLEHLASAADDLLVLAPRVEPPLGFETGALVAFETVRAATAPGGGASETVSRRRLRDRAGQRLGPRTRSVRPRSSRARMVVAVVLVVVLGAAVGLAAGRSILGGGGTASAPTRVAVPEDGAGDGNVFRTAGWPVRTGSGAEVGRVQLSSGARPRLVVRLDRGATAGTYDVSCDYESGAPYHAGRLVVVDGRPTTWSTGIDVGVYDLQRVRLVAGTGGANLEADVGV